MPKETKDEVTQADVNLAILQTLKDLREQAAGGANIGEALEKVTETLAGVAHRARPENLSKQEFKSVYNPDELSDADRPKLQCEIFWIGYPLTIETLTYEEIAALNTLVPGNYRVTKGNGNVIPFNVVGKTNDAGKVIELWVNFPCKGDQSTDHRSMVDYCREAMGEAVPSINDLMAELAKVKKELATAEAVIATA